MSAILPNGEIKPRRPDCLADDAVSGEPVSGSEFPVIREKTGNFAESLAFVARIGANLVANSRHFEIPCETEQGIAFA
jgi:hypothetical protein